MANKFSHIVACADKFRELFLSEEEGEVIEDKQFKIREYNRFFFIEMNEALFSGEYLLDTYSTEIAHFENLLSDRNDQSITKFIFCIQECLKLLRYLIEVVSNKNELLNDHLFYSAFEFSLGNGENEFAFFLDFYNFSFELAFTDHMLVIKNESDINKLLIKREELKEKLTVDDEDLKIVYEKLYSKCSFLLKKITFSIDPSKVNYSINFNTHCLYELTSDEYNKDFWAFFDCLNLIYKLDTNIYFYQDQFRNHKYSTVGFILLARFYRRVENSIPKIEELIKLFGKEYAEKKPDKKDFNTYAIETVRHFLANCLFSLKLEKEGYSIKQLQENLDQLEKNQESTKVFNYHPYERTLNFLSKKIVSDLSYTELDDCINLYDDVLKKYKKSIDWCIQRSFYPFQLIDTECITKGNVFIASSFARPVNVERLNSLYEEYRYKMQQGEMNRTFCAHKNKMNEMETRIKSFRKESFTYLGIFIAIITFLFGSLQLFASNNIDIHKALINVVSLGIVLCFFSLLICIVFREDKNRIYWLIGFIAFLISFLSVFIPSF